jgi:hypothetical protein
MLSHPHSQVQRTCRKKLKGIDGDAGILQLPKAFALLLYKSIGTRIVVATAL